MGTPSKFDGSGIVPPPPDFGVATKLKKQRAMEVYITRATGQSVAPRRGAATTIREKEVLNLIAHGKTNVEIASQLKISPRTVEHHRASLMRKLKCRNKAELIRYALEQRDGFLS